MKTVTLLSLSFILSVKVNAAPSSVLDVTGKNLQAGVNYYVIPAAGNSSGGGIAPGPTGPHKTCPLGITQLQAKKHALTFTPVNPKKRVIRLSTDTNIKFSGPTSCNESKVWRLKYDEAIQQYFFGGGVQGNPGRETFDNWFKVEKTEDGYKFGFCPTVCNFCKVTFLFLYTFISK
ncbi:proteinase inhibitor I3 [Tanacetum coccineum]